MHFSKIALAGTTLALLAVIFHPVWASADAPVTPVLVATVLVPQGTQVVVQLTEGLSSYAASANEPLDYQVSQDVVINGFIVAKAGDDANGIVLEAKQGSMGFDGIGYRAADLRVNVEEAHNFCGDTLKLHFIRSEYRRRQGVFGSNKDITIAKGQQYVAQVAYAQKICGAPTLETPPPIPGTALLPDQN